ncbi:MAG: GGDEF domain-containing protein [Spirochaetota bacterium]
MVRELVINLALIVSFASLTHQVYLQTVARGRLEKLYAGSEGVLMGILGVLLMLEGVTVAPSVILDLRSIPMIVSFIYGGVVPGIVTSAIIAGVRVLHFGPTTPSLYAVLVIVLAAVPIAMISRLQRPVRLKWLMSLAAYVGFGTLAFLRLVADAGQLFVTLLVFVGGTVAFGLLVERYITFLRSIAEAFIRYRSEAGVDFLTGIENVRTFRRRLSDVSKHARQVGDNLSVVMIDLDHFKTVNDEYGHEHGDAVLRQAAGLMAEGLRSGDTVSRYGGEEFTVTLNGCGAARALDIAERLRATVEEHRFSLGDGRSVRVTASLGVASYPATTRCTGDLVHDADVALYEAKRTGRNRVVLFARQAQVAPEGCRDDDEPA